MRSSFTNLCFKNLPLDFEKQDLMNLCIQFGNIKSAKIMFDLKTGKSKGFGFVRFQSIFSAELAKEKLNGILVSKNDFTNISSKSKKDVRKINVSYAISEENLGNTSNEILVSSLPLFFTTKDIYNLFSRYGRIRSIRMINDEEKKIFHGKAIIFYETSEEAEKALINLNNIKLSDDSWPLYIQFLSKCPNEIKRQQINIEKTFSEPNSYFIKYGIEIQKPNNKKFGQNVCYNAKKNQENTTNIEISRNWQLDNYMFKSIAEDL